MNPSSQVEIVDITKDKRFRDYLCRCIVGPPSKCCVNRIEYLKEAIPEGFQKKLLLLNNKIVGQIEYSPAEMSYYPIAGSNVIVLNCIWVFRKARDHAFGKMLVEDMIKSEEGASGFATIALENHWSPWFKKDQMEKLGFIPVDSISVKNKVKSRKVFRIYLMWMPKVENARAPVWNKHRLLEGTTSCTAHPLYHSQKWRERETNSRGGRTQIENRIAGSICARHLAFSAAFQIVC